MSSKAIFASMRFAFRTELLYEGTAIAASKATMATVIINSIKLKPRNLA